MSVNSMAELLAAVHWKVVPPFAQDSGNCDIQMDILARCIGHQVRAIGETGDCEHAICTTVMPSEIGCPSPKLDFLFGRVEEEAGRRPMALFHTYMCAGWGFALRFFSQNTDVTRLLVTIADVDPHDLRGHTYHPAIGYQGYGICTLLFGLPGTPFDAAVTGTPAVPRLFQEFVRAMRLHRQDTQPVRTFLPFLREDMIGVAESALGRDSVAPNRVAEYRHSFGSDPWIGIIEWLQQTPPDRKVPVSVGGIAFNGYYTVGSVLVSPDTRVLLRTVQGDDTSLLRAAAEPQIAISPNFVGRRVS
jgi:hypothetical protein